MAKGKNNNKKTNIEELDTETKKVETVIETTIEDDGDYEELSIEERIINIEKRTNTNLVLNVIILIAVILTLVIGVAGDSNQKFNDSGTGTTDTSTEENTAYDTSKFTEITASEVSKLSDGKTIVLWIGRQGCGWCSYFAPVMEETAEKVGFTAYYIDLGKIVDFSLAQPTITDSEAWNTLSGLSGSGDWATFAKDNMGGTPLTMVIKNNKVVGGVSGYTDVDTLTTALKTAGIK